MSTYNSYVAEDSADKTIKEVKNMKETIVANITDSKISLHSRAADIEKEIKSVKEECDKNIENIHTENSKYHEEISKKIDTLSSASHKETEAIILNSNANLQKIQEYNNLCVDRDVKAYLEIHKIKIALCCIFGLQLILGVIICIK